MCGFTGSISLQEIDNSKLYSANKLIECRGPDSTKSIQKKFDYKNVDFWFNRLAILDLDHNADQPMHSKEFQTTILFNGEIFNHNDLRKELINKGLKFNTSHSDTETLLIGFSYWGIDFIQKLRGQFSIAFLDEKNNKFYLMRDRVGQKPLYFNIGSKTIEFGSSLNSLLSLDRNHTIDEQEVYNYLSYGIISSPNTLFKSIKKLEPGHYLSVDLNPKGFKFSKTQYWNVEDFLNEKKFDIDEFFNIFTDSVNLRATADVPISNFLSGGVDSTSVIKNMLKGSSNINSFSVYFDNPRYDESKYIKQVVNKYNLNHTFVEMSSKISNDQIFEALSSLDEPYSDPSVIPSYLLSKEISKSFKVAISGDGGDELLGGYKRTVRSLNKGNIFHGLFSMVYKAYPPIFGTGSKFLSKSTNLETKYRSYLEDQKLLNIFGLNFTKYNYASELDYENENVYKSLLIADYQFYLPEMMMFKVDRTSMANSVEIRSPFVDHKLIEYIISTTSEYYDRERPKQLLKNYLKNDFDKEFLNRKKQGFVFDVENWVYENLDLVNSTLSNGKIIKELDKNIISKLSIIKSRINGQRIWKMFVLENYLNN